MAITVETLQHGALCYEPFIDKDTSESYMLMHSPLYWQFSIIMSSKTWPFMEQMNRIVHMQQESGIGYYWERNVNMNVDQIKDFTYLGKETAVGRRIFHTIGM